MTVQVDKTRVYVHIFVGNVETTKLSGRFVDVLQSTTQTNQVKCPVTLCLWDVASMRTTQYVKFHSC